MNQFTASEFKLDLAAAQAYEVDGGNGKELYELSRELTSIIDACCTTRQAQVLRMWLAGKNQVMIAKLLGVHKSTVSRTFARGCKRCRAELEMRMMVKSIAQQ